VQPTRAHRFGERIALDSQPVGHFRCLQTLIQELLRFFQHRRCQYRRPAGLPLGIKSFRSLLAVEFHGPFDTDRRYPKGPGNISLFGIAALTELGGDHPK
jgi:hypothetical protein